MKQGICQKRRKFYGLITVTDRGQIAIPASLRQELDIKKGNKLVVIKRDDQQGLNLLKVEAIDKFINKLSKK